MLVYIAYFNLMAFGRSQLEQGNIPLMLNFWWIHLIFIGLTIILLVKAGRGFVLHRRVLSR